MKKINSIFSILLVIFLFLGMSSCEKDSEAALTGKVWDYNKTTTTSTNEDVQALVALVNALMTGVTLEFFEDGTYEMDGPLMEEPDEGTWSLSEDGKVLTMDGDEMDVIKLNASEMIWQGEEVSNDYGTYSVKIYWK